MSEELFPFGKHKGEPIDVAETSYLKWLQKQDISTDLWEAIEEVLEQRHERR